MTEDSILGHLQNNDAISDSHQFAASIGIDHNELENVIKSLRGFEIVHAQEFQKDRWFLKDEGKNYAREGSPEVQLFHAVPPEGISRDELQKKVNPMVFKIGSSWAVKKKWVEIGRQGISRKDNTTIMLPVHTGSLRRTHYEVLSVSENATYNEIRERYKGEILSTHPDKLCGKHVADDPSGEQQEMFLSVQKAWEVLSDPNSRENYDNELQASRNAVEVVDCEIRLEEMLMHVDGDMKEFFYQCRCGDYFSVATFELAELGVLMEDGTGVHLHSTKNLTQASVVLPCSSCSLKIRLMVDVIC